MLWRYEISGIDTITLYLGERIDPVLAQRVHGAAQALQAQLGGRLLDVVPSYASIMLRYDLLQDDLASVLENVRHVLTALSETPPEDTSELVEIPVFYHPRVGPDLERVAHHAGLNIEDVIALHSKQTYLVYAIGFAPGFAYLGEVSARISTPRLATPRAHVPAGTLGIADRQTAIYPLDSPGGWNLIGRTPVNMFDTTRTPSSLLHAGQRVRFRPVEQDEYLALGGKIECGADQ